MFEISKKPQSIGQVLDTIFRLYKHCFLNALPLAILIAFLGNLFTFMEGINPNAMDSAHMTEAMSAQLLLSSLVSTLLLMILAIALLSRIHADAINQPISMGKSVSIGLRKLLPVLLFGIAYVIAILVPAVIGLFSASLLGLFGIPFAIAAFLLSVYLSVTMLLIPALMIAGNRSIFASFPECFRLIWGNWWRTTFVISVPSMIVAVLEIIAILCIGLAAVAVFGGNGNDIATGNILMVTLLGYTIVSGVLLPVIHSALLGAYYDLRARREGLDLEARLSE